MTKKTDLQQELLAKVKPGTKPSHLKKSKSLNDIPKAPPLPLSEIEELKKATELNTLLQEQLKEKQQEIETLRQHGEEANQQIESLRKELENSSPSELSESDQSLIARHKSLKDWFIQYSQNQTLEKELVENIEEASSELGRQDEKIRNLRSEVSKLKLTNQSLVKDLNLATRLAELRKTPYPAPEDNWDYLQFALYSLLTVVFAWWLVRSYYSTSKTNYA